MDAGVAIGWRLVDLERPGATSPLLLLAEHRGMIGCGDWRDEDLVFQFQSLRGLVGVATAQLKGLSTLVRDDSGLLLHPAITLIRGLAEACGTAMWMCEPWITPIDEDADVPLDEWKKLSAPILPRSQLVMLDGLADRGRRHRADGREDVAIEDDDRLRNERDRIFLAQAGVDTILAGDRRQWVIAGQRMPTRTELAVTATEYSYGQHFRNSGMNPYPMLSGYAHASLDVVFAYGTANVKPPLSGLLIAPVDEIHQIMSLGLRIYAAMLDFMVKTFGVEDDAFIDWDQQVNSFVKVSASDKPEAET
jgi:hypothetical protein